MKNVYIRHSVGKRYIEANYKQALANLEAAGKIHTNPSAERRQKRNGKVTFGDKVMITFPPLEKR